MQEILLTEEQIEKLPVDARKEYRKYYLMLHEKKTKSEINNDFLKFVKSVWPDFVEGSHHKKISDQFNRLARGDINRLIINMPPRHTKSEFASFLLPAWMIGKNPKHLLTPQSNSHPFNNILIRRQTKMFEIKSR